MIAEAGVSGMQQSCHSFAANESPGSMQIMLMKFDQIKYFLMKYDGEQLHAWQKEFMIGSEYGDSS